MERRIIIGLPGPWPSRAEIVAAIVSRSRGLLLAGTHLVDRETAERCEVEIYGHDPKLQRAFRIAGCGSIAEAELAAIGEHKLTLYCLAPDLSIGSARLMLRFGASLLDAGGLAVKIETSGTAHSAARWRGLAGSTETSHLYTAFVALVRDQAWHFTCGMHNFALPDSAAPGDLEPQDAIPLLNIFNNYVLAEKPALADGHTFSVAAGEPRYRLQLTSSDAYPPEHLYHNPFGTWRLTPA